MGRIFVGFLCDAENNRMYFQRRPVSGHDEAGPFRLKTPLYIKQKPLIRILLIAQYGLFVQRIQFWHWRRKIAIFIMFCSVKCHCKGTNVMTNGLFSREFVYICQVFIIIIVLNASANVVKSLCWSMFYLSAMPTNASAKDSALKISAKKKSAYPIDFRLNQVFFKYV